MQYTAVSDCPAQRNHRIYPALLLSLVLHAAVLSSMSFEPPEPALTKSMDVILVNSKSGMKPANTDVLAQANLDGGGNVAEDRRAKTPLPVLPGVKPVIE